MVLDSLYTGESASSYWTVCILGRTLRILLPDTASGKDVACLSPDAVRGERLVWDQLLSEHAQVQSDLLDLGGGGQPRLCPMQTDLWVHCCYLSQKRTRDLIVSHRRTIPQGDDGRTERGYGAARPRSRTSRERSRTPTMRPGTRTPMLRYMFTHVALHMCICDAMQCAYAYAARFTFARATLAPGPVQIWPWWRMAVLTWSRMVLAYRSTDVASYGASPLMGSRGISPV
eukprot:1183972-Rhodomonas_salina.1